MTTTNQSSPAEFSPAGTSLLPRIVTLQKIGMSNSQLYKLISEKKFPPPVKCGRSSLWVEKEVDTWILERIAERDAATN